MADKETPIAFNDIDSLGDNFILGETSQEILLDESSQHIAITDHMINQATRYIRIFTRDLDPLIYDREEVIDAMKRLAIGGRHTRVEILAFDTRRIMSRGHRLVQLSRSLSSSVEIRRPGKQYEKHLHAFITCDQQGYVYRTYADRYDGIANYNDARETHEFEKLFAEIWARSNVDTELRSLNI